ncbi:MAG TPA: GNAT family N-acetyltransferase [Actinomycetota bacterium]|jgi:predicted GNAT superfamily acetyltransferase|nr:GNAT family N-acetyltransferase [Actinomycetota bacterium]
MGSHGTVAPQVGHRLAEMAVAAASAAAGTAGVRVQDLHELSELERVCELYEGIWRSDPSVGPLVTTEWLRALSHAGNYVSGAFAGASLVGGCIGFFATPLGRAMHSHIAGVAAGMRGRNVGFALKLHQRAWALQRGITRITWTFDPLVRRNAWFNLAKLGALPTAYLESFYGTMRDGINAGEESDRILVDWPLDADRVVRACAGHPPEIDVAGLLAGGATVGLDADVMGRPVPSRAAGGVVLVGVPPDVERLRLEDRDAAQAWRFALREVLGGLLADGGSVTGFAREGWYVVVR